jgi:hypothetical protein
MCHMKSESLDNSTVRVNFLSSTINKPAFGLGLMQFAVCACVTEREKRKFFFLSI